MKEGSSDKRPFKGGRGNSATEKGMAEAEEWREEAVQRRPGEFCYPLDSWFRKGKKGWQRRRSGEKRPFKGDRGNSAIPWERWWRERKWRKRSGGEVFSRTGDGGAADTGEREQEKDVGERERRWRPRGGESIKKPGSRTGDGGAADTERCWRERRWRPRGGESIKKPGWW